MLPLRRAAAAGGFRLKRPLGRMAERNMAISALKSKGLTKVSVAASAKPNRVSMVCNEQHRFAVEDKKKFTETSVKIFSHNTRGMTRDEHTEEFTTWFNKAEAYAACLQETWRTGGDTEIHDDKEVFINHGPVKKLCSRGSLGVSIVLSSEAQKHWEAAGSERMTFGDRIVATRLCRPLSCKNRKKQLRIFLASAYSPVGAATAQVREKYYDDLRACINACRKNEIMVICTDANASVGVRSKEDNPFAEGRDQVRGPFGIDYQNKAGRELVTLLSTHELCLPSTYYQKKRYETWINPCSGRGHQLDHSIMRQSQLWRVRDAGRYGLLGKDSDHCPIRLELKMGKNHNPNLHTKRNTRVDRRLLDQDHITKAFADAVKDHMKAKSEEKTSMKKFIRAMKYAEAEVLMTDQRRQPGWYKAGEEYIEPAIAKRNATQAAVNIDPTTENRTALRLARKQMKKHVVRATNEWLDDCVSRVNCDGDHRPDKIWKAVKEIRNGKSLTRKLQPMKLKKDNGDMCQTPQENAKEMGDYLKSIFSKSGNFDKTAIEEVRQRNPARWAWMAESPSEDDIVRAISKLGNDKSGAETKIPAEYYKALEKDDEAKTYIRELVSEVWKSGSYPSTPIPTRAECEMPTSMKAEDLLADESKHQWPISFVSNPFPPGKGSYINYEVICHCTTIKQVLELDAHPSWLESNLRKVISNGHMTLHEPAVELPPMPSDENGIMFDEWDIARMKLLPKKGNLAIKKNWRGICLLDIASKIVSSILTHRMNTVQQVDGLEWQSGFRWARGTIDGSFSTNIGLQKRREHGLATWTLFIDLVKAFDTVVREVAFKVLRKFGFPDHFINIVIRLHKTAKIKFKVGDIDTELTSDIGVRQGSIEGPSIFLFVFQAAFETLKWPVKKPVFKTRERGKTMGDRWNRKKDVEEFELWASLFADDCELNFETRSDLEEGANYLYHHLRRFGFQMHIGHGEESSKTEAMYCPAPGDNYEDGDTSNIAVSDGFVSFTPDFRYLGSKIHHSLTSHSDIEARIKQAEKCFGALRRDVFKNKQVHPVTKGKVFKTLVLSLLLYGSECWCLTEKLRRRLQTFYRSCVRTMCRITIAHTIRHHIKTSDLLQRLKLHPIDHYIFTRVLRWAGHVSRMDMCRVPRKLLTGWVENPRPVGRPQFNFSHTLKKALAHKGLPTGFEEWSKLASDRIGWKNLMNCNSQPLL